MDSLEKRLSDPLAYDILAPETSRKLMMEAAMRIVTLQTALHHLVIALDENDEDGLTGFADVMVEAKRAWSGGDRQ